MEDTIHNSIQKNFGIELDHIRLGHVRWKYDPKVNETIAALWDPGHVTLSNQRQLKEP